MIVFLLQLFFKEGVSIRINSFQIVLNALEYIVNVFLPFENISKDIMVESDGILLNFS